MFLVRGNNGDGGDQRENDWKTKRMKEIEGKMKEMEEMKRSKV